jgi:hypothetical protein
MVPVVLIAAMIVVESGGDDLAINRAEQAVGCLQIRPAIIWDVEKLVGRTISQHVAYDREASIEILEFYLGHYATPALLGHEPTMEDMARIWNGGPDGWKKSETVFYWHKVKQMMDAQERAQKREEIRRGIVTGAR